MKPDDEIEDIYLDNDAPPKHRPGHHDLHPAKKTDEAYKTFGKALLGLLLVAVILTLIRGWELRQLIADFMAIFFIAAAGFKFVHIEAFVTAYREYDVIASRLRPWAYVLPFVEAFLGFWYLLSSAPNRLNFLALLLAGTAAYGALRAVRHPARHASYPSLGGIFHLPLVLLTCVENVALSLLAALLLVI
jgi:hypothetical protein